MDVREIALQLALAMVDSGQTFAGRCSSSEELGKEIAEFYNAILKNLKVTAD